MKISQKNTVRHVNNVHKIWIFSLLIFGCNSIPAHSASFNCEKAETIMEKTICSDAGLSTLDEQIAKLYAETKTELKDRPDERNDLIRDQRNWLNMLRTLPKASPCAVKPECLRDNYELRIRELGHKLKLARASAPTASGPSKDAVMERLSEQLAQLKELARKAQNVEISEIFKTDKPEVCEFIWQNLQQASVPEPTVHASTRQQKLELYQQLREMAFHNQQLFFAQGNIVEDSQIYRNNFAYMWDQQEPFFEFGGIRKDSANLMFSEPTTNTGYKRIILATILFDLDDKYFSLEKRKLGMDGLLWISPNGERAYSFEYWEDNLLDQPQNTIEGPTEFSGLITLDTDVMFWEVRKSTSYDNWLLVGAVQDHQDGQELSCSFKFNVNNAW